MADSKKPQTPLNPPIPLNINNPRRKHYHYTIFMYKAALVTVFLVLLPLFPSIAPEFINQTLHARSWELLQLILVGIAVSYGLFSKKNDNDEAAEKPTDHTHYNKPDALSYASKLLQVSPVFDDDDENEPDDHIEENNNKVLQTLNSQQYYRKQPVVVVAAPAQQSPKKGNIFVSNACEFTQKPLLLPVRSLKQPSEEDVLRSPVPWRSRSGRVEMVDQSTTTLPSQPDTDDVAAKEEVLVEKVVVMESSSDDDDDDDDEGDHFEGTISSENNNNNNNNKSVDDQDDDDDVGRDVDKKADEFIAKFREQIRLQRIESIRRTTDQRRRAAGKASRSN